MKFTREEIIVGFAKLAGTAISLLLIWMSYSVFSYILAHPDYSFRGASNWVKLFEGMVGFGSLLAAMGMLKMAWFMKEDANEPYGMPEMWMMGVGAVLFLAGILLIPASFAMGLQGPQYYPTRVVQLETATAMVAVAGVSTTTPAPTVKPTAIIRPTHTQAQPAAQPTATPQRVYLFGDTDNKVYVRFEGARLRYGPSTDSEILAKFNRGVELKVIGEMLVGEDRNWVPVSFGDRLGGFMAYELIWLDEDLPVESQLSQP